MENTSWERQALLDILNFIKDEEEAYLKKDEILNRLGIENRDENERISIITVIDKFIEDQINFLKINIDTDLVETVQSLDKELLSKEVNTFLREFINK
ncbi:hypothetical protein [Lysinibacillus endophyticus]|uniref:hypothetical protein n=1 Tax=Ureibacillus endophyticus TaxID=1978490 RepID=UPI00209CE9EE|nr:hypothetical protein [Lysinibacillus endophyticus]MCP1145803.1 hypothetical protein [Lysinibacillus endophyticus]